MTHDELIQILLTNRGINTPQETAEFFQPTHPQLLPSPFDSAPAIQLIKQHLSSESKIYIVGDYDVDGICSTAILWETLQTFSKNILPYIPDRRIDGYGLTSGVIDKVIAAGAKLVIAVDCGITSIDSVAAARTAGCDVLIIDHHALADKLPQANVILHSPTTCAAGLTWFFCRDLQSSFDSDLSGLITKLDLVALAVVCDIVPLLGLNRSLTKYGLAQLNSTSRLGLTTLFQISSLDPLRKPLGTYEIGFVIGPRLNAMGRLENALDSLRLLCTSNPQKALSLARLLDDTNQLRQDLTRSALDHALTQIDPQNLPHLIIVSDPTYDEGVIGLIAAKLVEKFHRPAIAFSRGPETSKGSARSIPGFDITSYLVSHKALFTSLGGHAMAAGMTISNANITHIPPPILPSKLLVRTRRVDAEIPLSLIDIDFYLRLQDFAPFGLGNPQPVFQSSAVSVSALQKIGKQLQHLKFKAGDLDAIWFNTDPSHSLNSPATLHYSLDLNTWNGRSSLQLVVKHAL